jgi:hypothetical protein
VLWVDYEDTRANVIERLRQLGMTVGEFARLVYVDAHAVEFTSLVSHLMTTKRDYGLMVVDGVTSSLSAAGLSGRDEQELTRWADALPRHARSAICVDHVIKASDERRGMAIGSQAKKSVVTGTAFEVVCTTKFGRGGDGVIVLKIQKDRRGGVRGTLRGDVRLVFHSDPFTGAVSLTVGAKLAAERTDADRLDAAVLGFLAEHGPATRTDVKRARLGIGTAQQRNDSLETLRQRELIGVVGAVPSLAKVSGAERLSLTDAGRQRLMRLTTVPVALPSNVLPGWDALAQQTNAMGI